MTPTVGYNPASKVFTAEQEIELVQYLKEASDLYYGLSPKEVMSSYTTAYFTSHVLYMYTDVD